MIRYIAVLFLLIALLTGCSKEEEKVATAKGIPKRTEIKDVELKNWENILNQKGFKIDISKLKDPFITPKVLKIFSTKKEKIPLKLVGILQKGKEKMALLEDDTGKGYIVKPGTKIGNIKILKVEKNYVVIEEKGINIYGEIEISRRVLSLKEEKVL